MPIGTCRDGLMNVDEVDVDCGPSCSAGCASGRHCTSDGECQTGFCNSAGICSVPSCNDGAKNRTETDMDCGGSDGCKACTVGQRCESNYDCDGGACENGRCQAASCEDGIRNQDESDVDCGGNQCDRCETKQHCKVDQDCSHAICSQGRCQAPGCSDGLQNGDETSADCGGSCATCADFLGCKVNADCTSSVCNPYAHACMAPTCTDGVQNGTEPTTDCGKDCQKKCSMLAACATDADCDSGACSDKRCVPKSASGQALSMTGWLPSASASFNADTSPDKALDGNAGTHWTSGVSQLPGMWYQIDMRETRPFFALDLLCTSNDDYPRSLRVQVSEDGQTFTAVTPTLAGTKTLHLDLGGKARVGRYIKIELEQDTGGTWWRIDDLRVLQ